MARRFLLAFAALPVAFTTAVAQANNPGNPASNPRVDYALTNARIVTAPGRVIERGTVITRDGRIAAVGANVAIPAGVVQIDLAGHSIYAGLIDAATSVGLPSPSRAIPGDDAGGRGGGGGGGGGGRGAAAPTAGRGAVLGRTAPPPPVILPEVDADAEAADMFAPTEEELKTFRASGVTAVGLVFDGGLFPGRVGAALTGSRDGARLSLRSGVGQQVSFGTKRGGAYPGTGIGSVAYIRQAFYDAQYESRVEKAFKAGTPGARPSNDPFRRSLISAATNGIPSWFIASNERQITRVAEIASELELRNPVVVGSQEGWRSIPALKKIGATALVSLRWPSPDSISGRAFLAVGSGKTGIAPPSTMADTIMVRGNAAALIKAGVPVALASFGGESGISFRDRIRTTIAAGLSADDALRATTVTPAALLGISSAVGTIEVGKLANLVVVSGNDLFAAGVPLKHVFVEGRLY